jgi:hypothetical protein
MAVADVSPGHQNAVGALLKCLENKVGFTLPEHITRIILMLGGY